MKQTTLCYPVKDGRVLLAMKKRGFGAGKWNGAGGKLKEGESWEDACRREVREEIGVEVGVLEDRGMIRFKFKDHPESENECRIYVTHDFRGTPTESEEMKPAWFPINEIPFQDMWDDDAVWLTDVLHGGMIRATATFEADKMIRWEPD